MLSKILRWLKQIFAQSGNIYRISIGVMQRVRLHGQFLYPLSDIINPCTVSMMEGKSPSRPSVPTYSPIFPECITYNFILFFPRASKVGEIPDPGWR